MDKQYQIVRRSLVVVALLVFASAGALPEMALGADEAQQNSDNRDVMINQDVVVVIEANGSTISALSHGSEWVSYECTAGQTAVPIISGPLVALQLRGGETAEIAAYSAIEQFWSTYKLDKPVRDVLSPIVDGRMAVYRCPGQIVAFSVETGTWDALASEGVPRVGDGWAIVVEKGAISVFDVQTGRWHTNQVDQPSQP